MTDLLEKLSYLIVNYLLPLIFPGHNNLNSRSIYYWIYNKPLVLLFVILPFVFYVFRIFWRFIKNI